jgi:hypothetical protein
MVVYENDRAILAVVGDRGLQVIEERKAFAFHESGGERTVGATHLQR